MITKLLQSLSHAAGVSTYQIGLLQSKAYRVLNQETAKVLEPYKISPIDWAILGLIYDNQKTGLRFSGLAKELGVEAPFITERSIVLQKLGLITQTTDEKDKRVKYLSLTSKGNDLVPTVDKLLIKAMRPLLDKTTIADLRGYKHVLESIASKSTK